MSVPHACRPERVSDPLGLVLEMVMSHHVGAHKSWSSERVGSALKL